MTHHDDMRDDEFEKYLKRASALSRQHHEAADDVVPAELDHKILMQARDAISDKSGKKVATHPSWWMKWNKPLALAASMMLAFTVIYKVGNQSIERLGEPAVQRATKQNESDKSSVTGSSAQNDMSIKDKSALASVPSKELRTENERALSEPERPVISQPLPASIPAPVLQKPVPAPSGDAAIPAQASPAPVLIAAPAEAKQDNQNAASAVAGNLRKSTEPPKKESTVVVDSITAEDIGKFPDSNVAESLQRVPDVPVQRDVDSTKEHKDAKKSDPKVLLQHIRELRKQGKNKDAEKAWQQFQIDFPYYEVAADDPARG